MGTRVPTTRSTKSTWILWWICSSTAPILLGKWEEGGSPRPILVTPPPIPPPLPSPQITPQSPDYPYMPNKNISTLASQKQKSYAIPQVDVTGDWLSESESEDERQIFKNIVNRNCPGYSVGSFAPQSEEVSCAHGTGE